MKKFISFLLLVALVSCNKQDVPNVHDCYLTFAGSEPGKSGTKYYRDKKHRIIATKFIGGDSTAVMYDDDKLSKTENYKDGAKTSHFEYVWEDHKLTQNGYDKDGKQTVKIEYSLDEKGNAKERAYTILSGTTAGMTSKTEYNFDANENVIEVKWFDEKGILSYRVVSEYDDKLNPGRSGLNMGDNSKHNAIRATAYDKDGKQVSNARYTYIYNDKNLPIEQRDSAGKPLAYYQYECE